MRVGDYVAAIAITPDSLRYETDVLMLLGRRLLDG